jgi:DNA adenine methylase
MPTSAHAIPLAPNRASLPVATPIIKWVGGKGKLLAQLAPLLPPAAEERRHVEPFMGGAAMFFARQPERALLSDVNPELIGVYQAVRDDVEGVIAGLSRLAAAGHTAEAYYGVRTRYNEGRRTLSGKAAQTSRAAMFIYLNKTCFNGLHRVNRSGAFNVPAGKYKNPRILDVDNLRAASRALRSAELRCAGFEELLGSARPGDFVYLDPPYVPASATANFTAYAQDAFGPAEQERLRDVYRELDRRGCRLMLSNSDVPAVRELYREWRIDVVMAPRAVSCDGAGRQSVAEVVVRNY